MSHRGRFALALLLALPACSDGCASLLDCGPCLQGQTCGFGGVPNVCGGGCVPTTCAAQGKNCGTIADGCGQTISCGTCGGGQTCNSGVCSGGQCMPACYNV